MTFTEPGYYQYKMQESEKIEINMKDGKFDCFFSLSVNSRVNITSSNDNENIIFDGSCGFIQKNSVFIQSFNKATIQLWVFNQGVCFSGELVYFTTPHKFKDMFKLHNNISQLCLFFGNENPEMRILLKYSHPQIMPNNKIDSINQLFVNENNGILTSFFIENQFDVPHHICSSQTKQVCSFKAKQHFFIVISNIPKNETITVEYSLAKEESLDIQCDHYSVPIIKDDIVFESEDIFTESIITCHNEMINLPDDEMIIFFISLGIITALCAFLYFCGCCKWLGKIIRGKLIIHEINAKGTIDTKKLNKQKEDKITVLSDIGEEEEAIYSKTINENYEVDDELEQK